MPNPKLVIIFTLVFALVVIVLAATFGSDEANGDAKAAAAPVVKVAERSAVPATASNLLAKREAVRIYSNTVRWIAVTNYKTWMETAIAQQNAARAAVAKRTRPKMRVRPNGTRTTRTYAPAEQSSGRCGGNLPPCYVMNRESGGNLRAENPTSSASGKWQFVDGTWNGYGGYSHASQAPESVQDAKAAQLWAGGSGCGHWSAC